MAYLGRKGAPAPINAGDIPDDSITSAKILADAVGSSDLAPDIVLTGGSVQIPSVTTANRPGESGGTNASQTATVGMIIYNSTIGMLQQYGATGWAAIDSPPTVSSLNYPGDDTALDTVGEYNDATCDYNNDPTITHDTNSNMKVGMSVSGTGIPVGATIASVTSTTAFELSASTTGGAVTNGTLTFNTQTLVITGTNFQIGVTVAIDGTAPSTVARDSSTQITVTGTPAKTAGTKVDGLVVTNLSGLVASINVDYSALPAWTTSSGNILNAFNGLISTIDLVATGDAPITYAITTGSLTGSGLSMALDDGDITGTMSGSATTYNFTVTATDAEAQSSPRLFNIISKGTAPTSNGHAQLVTGSSYRYHIWTATSGTLNITPASNLTFQYFIVAGGGGGGSVYYAGGGGAGGVRYGSFSATTSTVYTVDIGAGGAGGGSSSAGGTQGTQSFISGSGLTTITATGGGGGTGTDSGTGYNGTTGGSGGGGGEVSGSVSGWDGINDDGTFGSATWQGYDGGDAYETGAGNQPGTTGGGGGGASQVGQVGQSTSVVAYGGDGTNYIDSWVGEIVAASGAAIGHLVSGVYYFAGGGGGGTYDTSAIPTGGDGGGGRGASSGNTGGAGNAVSGTANTGGGGGGADFHNGSGSDIAGAGGSGIVVIRY